ncbi:MAG TPA: hypothetical protein VFE41_18105 [Acetobacteraceae bacterium]|nr:hypothetical protein [Acetobacteraceae bacterium]
METVPRGEGITMQDKPNFVLVPDPVPGAPPAEAHPQAPTSQAPTSPALTSLLAHLRALVAPLIALLPGGAAQSAVPATTPTRPRLIFGFDATASREPAWDTARKVTDSMFRALPGELDVALAVHGGSFLHTFTDFTSNPATLRDRAATIRCMSGRTQLLPILSRALAAPGVRVVTYIGDVVEESPARGRKLADAMGARGIRLIVLHDVADWLARRDAELFQDLARRTGGCVLPFDASAPDRLRELLAAVAVYAVGGTDLLERKRADLPAAALLLSHLHRD